MDDPLARGVYPRPWSVPLSYRSNSQHLSSVYPISHHLKFFYFIDEISPYFLDGAFAPRLPWFCNPRGVNLVRNLGVADPGVKTWGHHPGVGAKSSTDGGT